MHSWKRLKRKISAWLFIHSIGKLAKEYRDLPGQVARLEFGAKHFGKDFPDVQHYKIVETVKQLEKWKVKYE